MGCGRLLGCHQRPERSFFFRGHQFPMCARCTGLLAGYLIFFVLFRVVRPSIEAMILFPAIMLADWLMQQTGLRESTNVRRLITGILCGYGLAGLYVQAFAEIRKIFL